MLAPEEADPSRRASNEQPSEDVMSIIQVRTDGRTDGPWLGWDMICSMQGAGFPSIDPSNRTA